MKITYLFGLLFCVTVSVFAQDTKTTDAKLKEVTVFFNGAELTHETKISLQKGNNEIKISDLSPILDKNSVKIKTSSNVLVSSFEFSTDYIPEKIVNNDEIKKLEDNISNYKKQLSQININLKINKEVLIMLGKGISKSIESSEHGLNINDLKLSLDYYKSKSLVTEELIYNDTEEKKRLEENIKNLQAQLNQESKKNNKLSGILTVNFMAVNAGNCDITISYYTSAARWIPYYDINVQSIKNPINIISKAKIAQTSGIEWNNIKLSLSTSTPNFGKVAPLFKTWFLQYVQQYYPKQTSAEMMQNSYLPKEMEKVAAMSIAEYNEDEEYLIEESEENMKKSENITMNYYIQSIYNQLNIVYDINLPYTISSNGKDLAIELQSQEINAKFKYYSVPKLDNETYLIGEIADWQKLNLLSGTANVTYDGTYVGETYIDASSTLENLTLTLGADKRIPVKREKLTEYSSTPKIIGSDTKQTFAYQLTVRNNQNVPINMVLKDQYPISTRKEIEVELLTEITTKPTFNNTDVGVINWEFELQPGEQKIFKIAYSVKYPKGKILNL